MKPRIDQSSPQQNGQSTAENCEPCQFYMKIGACRHGDKCSRIHTKPTRSNTILLKNLYRQAKVFLFPYGVDPLSDALEQSIFEEFYEEVYTEIASTCGKIREMHVCENHGAHLNGNVYVKFYHSSAAVRAVKKLCARFFAGSTLDVELSPVHDFIDASCRQHQTSCCSRGGICNFMHVKTVRSVILDRLQKKSVTSSPSASKEISKSQKDSDSDITNSSDDSSRKRKRTKKDDENEEEDHLPTKYQAVFNSSSNDETSSDSFLDESFSDDSRATPKAFRTERFNSDQEPDEINQNEIAPAERAERRAREIKKMQIIRHRRWELLQSKLKPSMNEEIYDSEDEHEKNFVFSLL
ncbi:unnamed protein product, partial [Mesorhabditis belari]|uniref:Uncharacterized protein n=1 Tax=Mesorhabditis belari TaxID=2138241 RepID=A0AAF3EVE7_9BILA